MAIRVLINGAFGKMGQAAMQAFEQDPEFIITAAIGSHDNLKESILTGDPHIVVDFTTPAAVFHNVSTIIEMNKRPIVGTTGLTTTQIDFLQGQCLEKKLGGVIAPNFSMGAVLLMKLAQEAAKYFHQVEIIEMHHDGKEDSPSGTALKTAEMIAAHRSNPVPIKQQRETIPGARGANHHHIPIHAIRLPGLVAHEEVIFGSHGETLRLRHDAINRECFMPGLLIACRKVMFLNELIYGLENIL